MKGSTPPHRVLLLALLLLPLAGCIGPGEDLDTDEQPIDATAQADQEVTFPLIKHGLLHLEVGAGSGRLETFAMAGEFDMDVRVPEGAKAITFEIREHDPGVNATGPAAGMPAFSIYQGSQRVAYVQDVLTQEHTVTFQDPSATTWAVEIHPEGPAVDRAASVTVTIEG